MDTLRVYQGEHLAKTDTKGYGLCLPLLLLINNLLDPHL